jgi:putative transposase
VSAETKLELLGLVDSAVAAGWAHVRVCRMLEIEDVRVHRWRRRLQEHGTLEDRPPVGNAVHRILPEEERAILELIEEWAWVDRSHRKLAHRGSYTGVVFVSPSTLLRVALKHRIELPGEPVRPRPALPAFPEIPWEKNRIWIWDASHFTYQRLRNTAPRKRIAAHRRLGRPRCERDPNGATLLVRTGKRKG